MLKLKKNDNGDVETIKRMEAKRKQDNAPNLFTYLDQRSGAKRIIDACRAQNVEEPTWSDHGGFITVTFKRPSKQDLEDHDPQNGGNMIKSRPEKRNSSPDSSPEGSPVVLAGTLEFINSSSEIKVLMLLKSYPTLTLEKVAILMNMTKRGVIKITNKLQENGKLSRKGANKNGEWIVND